jgi:hypothetical protein
MLAIKMNLIDFGLEFELPKGQKVLTDFGLEYEK